MFNMYVLLITNKTCLFCIFILFQPVESMQVEVLLERIDGSLGFNIMGSNEV